MFLYTNIHICAQPQDLKSAHHDRAQDLLVAAFRSRRNLQINGFVSNHITASFENSGEKMTLIECAGPVSKFVLLSLVLPPEILQYSMKCSDIAIDSYHDNSEKIGYCKIFSDCIEVFITGTKISYYLPHEISKKGKTSMI